MAQISFYTALKEAKAEVIITESKFISIIKPVNTEKEAANFIKKIKSEYLDASHVCYAYSILENAKTKKEKAFDDGEPSGTAGRPILEFLKNKNIKNVVLVVVRYFGGTLLGAAGLIKAYQKAAEKATDKAGLVLKSLCNIFEATVNYNEVKKIEAFISNEGVKEIDVSYEEDVIFTLAAAIDDYKKIIEKLEEALSRKPEVSLIESRFE